MIMLGQTQGSPSGPASPWPSGRGLSILAADENPADRQLLARAVERSGIDANVTFHATGTGLRSDLLERNEDRLPDLVILELRLPGLDGFGVLDAMQERSALQRIPVLVFTGWATASERERAYAAGATYVEIKPPTFADWVEVAASLPQRVVMSHRGDPSALGSVSPLPDIVIEPDIRIIDEQTAERR